MRKAYIAPDCEYMTFTVDDLIATNCQNTTVDFGGDRWSSGASCTIPSPDGGGTVFTVEPACTDTDSEFYCYMTSAIQVFAS